MIRVETILVVIACLACDSFVFGQEAINLPVMDLKGKVVSVSGFELNGESSPSYEINLNPKKFGISVNSNGLTETPLLGFANHPSIRVELSLSDSQCEQLRQLNEIQREDANAIISEIPLGIDRTNLTKIVREQMTVAVDHQTKQLKEILLPHQLERIQQISFQSLVLKHGVMGVLISEQYKDQFGLDDAESERLFEKAKEIENELAEEIKQLKLKARENFLSQLTPEQRAKFNELHGERFQTNPKDWKNFKFND